MIPRISLLYLVVFAIIYFSSCYFMRGSSGGGQTEWQPPRQINPADIALPPGYKIEAVAQDLNFPTGIAFDDENRPHVIEAGYSYGEIFAIPKILRLEENGKKSTVAEGDRNGPWTSIFHYNGAFIIAEGGQMQGGKILKISPEGEISVLAEGLPGMGDHHTNGAIVGPDGYIYFGQGTATNSGVVGPDNAHFGWLSRFPEFHDIPCKDIQLTGKNFESEDPMKPGSKVRTGAFSPFGTQTKAGQIIKGKIPCNGAVMRIPFEGGMPELVAWGFRNPFGLAFSPDGQLYVTENGFDERGSRPVWGAGDVLWKVSPNTWYGWPDFAEGRPLNDTEPLIQNYPNDPPRPVAVFGVHSSSNGFDFSTSDEFGYIGQAFVAQFGDQAPEVGKVLSPVGYKIVRVNVQTGVIYDFVVNKGKTNGPASLLKTGGLERPVAVRFNRNGSALFIVDFGVLLANEKGVFPQENTGVVWKVTREEATK